MSFNGLPRYACLKCSWVLETPQQEYGLLCPRCGKKLDFLDIRVLTRMQMAHLFSWLIFMFGNLSVLGIQAYYFRGPFEIIGVVAFGFIISVFAYFNYKYARLFKLAWGKSWMSQTIPAKRMMDMTYLQAVEKVKMEQPKMNN